jgi:hypothetical protein
MRLTASPENLVLLTWRPRPMTDGWSKLEAN